MAVYTVRLSRTFEKSLRRIPEHIRVNAYLWVNEVRVHGLEEVMKIPGLHDEPLKGKRFGQRSIRLSRSYRLFYRVLKTDESTWVELTEINHHEY